MRDKTTIGYPPPYEHLFWDYNKVNGIKKSVNLEVMFNNKSVHKQVSTFNETHEYIFKLYFK